MPSDFKLKIYNKDTDIQSGEVDLKKLDAEIRSAACVNSFRALGQEASQIIVYGESIGDESALDNIVLSHSSEEDLDDLQKQLDDEVDDCANGKRSQFLTPHMDLTYINKKLEAQKFKDAGNPENEIDENEPFSGLYPYVSAYRYSEELATGEESAAKILGMSAVLTPIDAKIEKHRNTAKNQIKKHKLAANRSLMRAARTEARNAINGISEIL